MCKEYKVEVLLSYDKNDEDSEVLTFHIKLTDEETCNGAKKEESIINKCFKKAEVWIRPGVYHKLSIKSAEEVEYA